MVKSKAKVNSNKKERRFIKTSWVYLIILF